MANRTADQTKPAAKPDPDPAAKGRVGRLADDPTETWPAQLAENGGPPDLVPTGASLVVAGDTARLLGTAELAEIKHAAHTIAADADIISRLDTLREQAMTALRDGRPVDPAVIGQVLDQARGWVAVRGLNGRAPAGGGS